ALLMADVPRARLLLVGEGPQAASLRRQAAELGISDAVIFTGAVAPADVPGYLGEMDIAVAPYPAPSGDLDGGQDSYFSPLKVLEYMAAGLPVVASAVGQVPELLGVDDTAAECGPEGRGSAEAEVRRRPHGLGVDDTDGPA